ncbi:MAG: helix-turn-helix domain-containing protein, partial [Candidatus Eisenbacteria bacterium]
WPGNVRELKNVIERVLLLEAEEEILPHHLPAELTGGASAPAAAGPAGTRAAGITAGAPTGDPFPRGVVRPLIEVEQMAIAHALAVCDGNKTRAAQLLGISRQTLRTKLKELRMDDEHEGTPEG